MSGHFLQKTVKVTVFQKQIKVHIFCPAKGKSKYNILGSQKGNQSVQHFGVAKGKSEYNILGPQKGNQSTTFLGPQKQIKVLMFVLKRKIKKDHFYHTNNKVCHGCPAKVNENNTITRERVNPYSRCRRDGCLW